MLLPLLLHGCWYFLSSGGLCLVVSFFVMLVYLFSRFWHNWSSLGRNSSFLFLALLLWKNFLILDYISLFGKCPWNFVLSLVIEVVTLKIMGCMSCPMTINHVRTRTVSMYQVSSPASVLFSKKLEHSEW